MIKLNKVAGDMQIRGNKKKGFWVFLKGDNNIPTPVQNVKNSKKKSEEKKG